MDKSLKTFASPLKVKRGKANLKNTEILMKTDLVLDLLRKQNQNKSKNNSKIIRRNSQLYLDQNNSLSDQPFKFCQDNKQNSNLNIKAKNGKQKQFNLQRQKFQSAQGFSNKQGRQQVGHNESLNNQQMEKNNNNHNYNHQNNNNNKIININISSVKDMTLAQSYIDYNYTKLLQCKHAKADRKYSLLLQPFMQQYYVFDMKQYVFPLKINFSRVLTAQMCFLYIGFDKQHPGLPSVKETSMSMSLPISSMNRRYQSYDFKIHVQRNSTFEINKKGNTLVDKIYLLFTTKRHLFQGIFKICSGISQSDLLLQRQRQGGDKHKNLESAQYFEYVEHLKKKDKFLMSKEITNSMSKTVGTLGKFNNNSINSIGKNLPAAFMAQASYSNSSKRQMITTSSQKFINKSQSNTISKFKPYSNVDGNLDVDTIGNSSSANKNQNKGKIKRTIFTDIEIDKLSPQKLLKTGKLFKMKTQTQFFLQDRLANYKAQSPRNYTDIDTEYKGQEILNGLPSTIINFIDISPQANAKKKRQQIQLWIQKNNSLKILVKTFKQSINQYHLQKEQVKVRQRKVAKNLTILVQLLKFIQNSHKVYEKKKKQLSSVFKINYFISKFIKNIKKKKKQSEDLVPYKNHRISYGLLPITQLLSKILYKNSSSEAQKVISTTFQQLYNSLATNQMIMKSQKLIQKIRRVQIRYKQTHNARKRMLMIFAKNHINKMLTLYPHLKNFQAKLYDKKFKILQKLCLDYLKDQIIKGNDMQRNYIKKIAEIQEFKQFNQDIMRQQNLKSKQIIAKVMSKNNNSSPYKFHGQIRDEYKNKDKDSVHKKGQQKQKYRIISHQKESFNNSPLKNPINRLNSNLKQQNTGLKKSQEYLTRFNNHSHNHNNNNKKFLQIPKNPCRPQKRLFRNVDILRSMVRGWFQIEYKKWQKSSIY